jgi:hypothetical protein
MKTARIHAPAFSAITHSFQPLTSWQRNFPALVRINILSLNYMNSLSHLRFILTLYPPPMYSPTSPQVTSSLQVSGLQFKYIPSPPHACYTPCPPQSLLSDHSYYILPSPQYSFMCPYTALNTLFSHTVALCVSSDVRGQVSYLYKTKDKIIHLYKLRSLEAAGKRILIQRAACILRISISS